MYTYLMKSSYGYKIGKSKNPENRLKIFLTGTPDMRIIAYGKGNRESILHDKYRSKRLKGEYFKLNRKDVENIIRLLKNEFSPQPDSKTYQRKLNYVIPFGKFKGYQIKDMTTKEELQYMKWFLKNTYEPKSEICKIFRWWLRQMI